MQRIIWKHGVRVDIVADSKIWGITTNRWSKKSIRGDRDFKIKKKGKCVPSPGQVAQREWDCRFCKKECGTLGDLTDHLHRSHWSDSTYARLRPKMSTRQAQEQPYKCGVPGCTLNYTANYKEIPSHYKDPRQHSVEELLDAGVSAWFYRKEREDDCRAIANWLEEKNYVIIVEQNSD